MRKKMTIQLQDKVYLQFTQLIPVKKRSQYIEQLIIEAIRKEQLIARDAEYTEMANDPDSQADAVFFENFCGDIE
jgi:metal-responsive CopG/Arc/MetJ family transcriptional regulator